MSVGAPTIEIEVAVGPRSASVRFDIDTGAAATVLSTADARSVLGVEYEFLDFRSDPRRVGVRGFVGEQAAIAQRVRLTLRSDEDEHRLELPILIAPPPANRIVPPSLPSLLGRDVLRHFRLELAYGDSPRVRLDTL